MRRPRFTTRRAMLGVALLALALWPAATACRVELDPAGQAVWHVQQEKGTITRVVIHSAPFWPRFRVALLGGSWPGDYQCRCPNSGSEDGSPVRTLYGRNPAYFRDQSLDVKDALERLKTEIGHGVVSWTSEVARPQEADDGTESRR